MIHHTKNKGDLGTAKVLTDLLTKNIQICLPLSEHMPFDLIGVKETGEVLKISVKYREVKKGAVYVSFTSSYADKNGSHFKAINKDLIDYLAIYCPDTDEVYYVNPKKFDKNVTLRIKQSKNNQTAGINFAKDYLMVP